MNLLDIVQNSSEAIAVLGGSVAGAAKLTHAKMRKKKIIVFARDQCGYQIPIKRNQQLFDAAKPMYSEDLEPPEEIKYEFFAIYDKIDFDQKDTIRNQPKKTNNAILQAHMGEYLSRPEVRKYILNS